MFPIRKFRPRPNFHGTDFVERESLATQADSFTSINELREIHELLSSDIERISCPIVYHPNSSVIVCEVDKCTFQLC